MANNLIYITKWEFQQVKNISSEKPNHLCQIPQALRERIAKITHPKSSSIPSLVQARQTWQHSNCNANLKASSLSPLISALNAIA
jgi:hypothetical protein